MQILSSMSSLGVCGGWRGEERRYPFAGHVGWPDGVVGCEYIKLDVNLLRWTNKREVCTFYSDSE